MPITLKNWQDLPSTATPINRESLQDLEKRQGEYTEQFFVAQSKTLLEELQALSAKPLFVDLAGFKNLKGEFRSIVVSQGGTEKAAGEAAALSNKEIIKEAFEVAGTIGGGEVNKAAGIKGVVTCSKPGVIYVEGYETPPVTGKGRFPNAPGKYALIKPPSIAFIGISPAASILSLTKAAVKLREGECAVRANEESEKASTEKGLLECKPIEESLGLIMIESGGGYSQVEFANWTLEAPASSRIYDQSHEEAPLPDAIVWQGSAIGRNVAITDSFRCGMLLSGTHYKIEDFVFGGQFRIAYFLAFKPGGNGEFWRCDFNGGFACVCCKEESCDDHFYGGQMSFNTAGPIFLKQLTAKGRLYKNEITQQRKEKAKSEGEWATNPKAKIAPKSAGEEHEATFVHVHMEGVEFEGGSRGMAVSIPGNGLITIKMAKCQLGLGGDAPMAAVAKSDLEVPVNAFFYAGKIIDCMVDIKHTLIAVAGWGPEGAAIVATEEIENNFFGDITIPVDYCRNHNQPFARIINRFTGEEETNVGLGGGNRGEVGGSESTTYVPVELRVATETVTRRQLLRKAGPTSIVPGCAPYTTSAGLPMGVALSSAKANECVTVALPSDSDAGVVQVLSTTGLGHGEGLESEKLPIPTRNGTQHLGAALQFGQGSISPGILMFGLNSKEALALVSSFGNLPAEGVCSIRNRIIQYKEAVPVGTTVTLTVSGSTEFKGKWISTTSYEKENYVEEAGLFYFATKKSNSAEHITPSLDTAHIYWKPYETTTTEIPYNSKPANLVGQMILSGKYITPGTKILFAGPNVAILSLPVPGVIEGTKIVPLVPLTIKATTIYNTYGSALVDSSTRLVSAGTLTSTNELVGAAPATAWNSGISYIENVLVSEAGKFYRAKTSSTGVQPSLDTKHVHWLSVTSGNNEVVVESTAGLPATGGKLIIANPRVAKSKGTVLKYKSQESHEGNVILKECSTTGGNLPITLGVPLVPTSVGTVPAKGIVTRVMQLGNESTTTPTTEELNPANVFTPLARVASTTGFTSPEGRITITAQTTLAEAVTLNNGTLNNPNYGGRPILQMTISGGLPLLPKEGTKGNSKSVAGNCEVEGQNKINYREGWLWTGAYSSTVEYGLNELVTEGGKTYVFGQPSTGVNITQPPPLWTAKEFAVGTIVREVAEPWFGSAYAKGIVVTEAGKFYKAKEAFTSATVPSADSTHWEPVNNVPTLYEALVTQKPSVGQSYVPPSGASAWSETTKYALNELVWENGKNYRSTVSGENKGHKPSTDAGVHWELLSEFWKAVVNRNHKPNSSPAWWTEVPLSPSPEPSVGAFFMVGVEVNGLQSAYLAGAPVEFQFNWEAIYTVLSATQFGTPAAPLNWFGGQFNIGRGATVTLNTLTPGGGVIRNAVSGEEIAYEVPYLGVVRQKGINFAWGVTTLGSVEYSSTTSYEVGAIVFEGGKTYYSKTAGNKGNTPSTDVHVHWAEVGTTAGAEITNGKEIKDLTVIQVEGSTYPIGPAAAIIFKNTPASEGKKAAQAYSTFTYHRWVPTTTLTVNEGLTEGEEEVPEGEEPSDEGEVELSASGFFVEPVSFLTTGATSPSNTPIIGCTTLTEELTIVAGEHEKGTGPATIRVKSGIGLRSPQTLIVGDVGESGGFTYWMAAYTGLNISAPWATTTTYTTGNLVEEAAKFFKAKNESLGVSPVSDVSHTHWEEVGFGAELTGITTTGYQSVESGGKAREVFPAGTPIGMIPGTLIATESAVRAVAGASASAATTGVAGNNAGVGTRIGYAAEIDNGAIATIELGSL